MNTQNPSPPLLLLGMFTLFLITLGCVQSGEEITIGIPQVDSSEAAMKDDSMMKVDETTLVKDEEVEMDEEDITVHADVNGVVITDGNTVVVETDTNVVLVVPVETPEIIVDTETDTETSTELEGEFPIEYWCIPGQTASISSGDGSTHTVIEGVFSYEGKTLCKGVSVTETPNFSVTTTYYFSYKNEEMYILTNAGGQNTVVHLVNGEIV